MQALSLHYQLCFHSKFVRHLSARKKSTRHSFTFMSLPVQSADGTIKWDHCVLTFATANESLECSQSKKRY